MAGEPRPPSTGGTTGTTVELPRPVRWARRRLLETLQENGWIAPALGGLAGTILGLAVGTRGSREDAWTISVDRSRDILGNSLALVFVALSIVLALASVAAQGVANRFGSRALRIYARRSSNRLVIGTFALAAMFILAAQFDARRLDPDAPAPVAALLISIIMLIVTAGSVMWYVASVIRWFRVDRVARGISDVVRRVAADLAHERASARSVEQFPPRPDSAADLIAPGTGHIAEIDADVLLEHCRRVGVSAVVTLPIGHPVIAGEPIGWVERSAGGADVLPPAVTAYAVDVAESREIAHSIEYGLTALVDIALIALSPAVNDPNSAAEVVEQMTFLFADLAGMPLGPAAFVSDDGHRVVVRSRTFGELVEFATEQLLHHGLDDPHVVTALRRFARSLERLDLAASDRTYVDALARRLGPLDPRTASDDRGSAT